MRQHLISWIGAGAIAAGVITAMPAKVTQVNHAVYLSKHAWPDLTDVQKANLAGALAPFKSKIRIDIVCNDAGCSDLAQDIDDACEDAGVDSVLDKALGPLGYGIGVQANEADKADARTVSVALQAAGIDAPVVPGNSAAGFVTIMIGKHPR